MLRATISARWSASPTRRWIREGGAGERGGRGLPPSVSTATASSPGSGTARRRRSLSLSAASPTAVSNALERRRRASNGTTPVTAESVLKARKNHMPVIRARATPRSRGRKAVTSCIRARSGGGGVSTSRGISRPAVPGSALSPGPVTDGLPVDGRSAGKPSSAILQVLEPHAITELVVSARSRIRVPSTLVPLAECASISVIRLFPTTRVA